MGGSINVAIRLKDGRSFCQERWTNQMPYRIKNIKTLYGDTDHLLEYIDMTVGNNKTELGSPQRLRNSSYGLLVVDCVNNLILDNNGYSSPNHYDSVETGGANRDENFVEFAQAGKISLEKTYFNRVNDDFKILRTEVIKLSPDEAIDAGEKEHMLSFRDASGFKPSYHARFLIDMNPMTYIRFEENREGQKAYKAKLLDIGFPTRRKDGLNATLRYVNGKLTRI